MLWVYAIWEHAPEPPLAAIATGLADAPLDAVRAGPLAAVVSRHAEAPASPTRAALWEHERVVEALMAERPVLPMRFGSTVDGEPRIRAFLDEREAPLAAALARVRGHVELSVRALAREPAPPDLRSSASRDGTRTTTPPDGTSGRDYLLALLARERVADDAADALHAPLATLAADAHRAPPRDVGELLRGAYLVPRAAIPRFRRKVDQLQARRPDVTFLCTGPWPPYSFVESEDDGFTR